MSIICLSDGHVIELPIGDFCQDHGVRWFTQCPACSALWSLTWYGENRRGKGADFCSGCESPGPWLSRSQLIEWMRSNLKASAEVPMHTRHELLDILARLEAMDANDTKTAPSWGRLREAAPKVWEATKPVRDALIGEAVKKAIEL